MGIFSSAPAATLAAIRLSVGFAKQDTAPAVVEEVGDRATLFQERIWEMSRQLHAHDLMGDPKSLSEEQKAVYEFFNAATTAIYKLSPELRESMIHWTIQEVAARSAVERMASDHSKALAAKAS